MKNTNGWKPVDNKRYTTRTYFQRQCKKKPVERNKKPMTCRHAQKNPCKQLIIPREEDTIILFSSSIFAYPFGYNLIHTPIPTGKKKSFTIHFAGMSIFKTGKQKVFAVKAVDCHTWWKNKSEYRDVADLQY